MDAVKRNATQSLYKAKAIAIGFPTKRETKLLVLSRCYKIIRILFFPYSFFFVLLSVCLVCVCVLRVI